MQGNPTRRLQALHVSDAMNRQVFCVATHESMEDVAASFAERGVTFAPVVDEHGHCVGALSAADFIRRDRRRDQPSSGPSMEEHTLKRSEGDDPMELTSAGGDLVCHFMSDGVQTVRREALLLHAARMMNDVHVHRLPVTDSEGKIVGVISTMDVVAALVHAMDEAQQVETTP